MKTLINVLGICVLGSALSLQAADFSRCYFKIDAGVNAIFNDVEIKNSVTPGRKISFDPGVRVDLVGGCRFSDCLAAEIELGGMWNQADKLKGGNLPDRNVDANLWQVPLMANLVYTFPLQSRFKPFIGAGAGGIYTRLEGGNVNGDQDDFQFAYQGFAGISYVLNECMDIGLTYKFLGTLDHHFDDFSTKPIYNHSLLASFNWRF